MLLVERIFMLRVISLWVKLMMLVLLEMLISVWWMGRWVVWLVIVRVLRVGFWLWVLVGMCVFGWSLLLFLKKIVLFEFFV